VTARVLAAALAALSVSGCTATAPPTLDMTPAADVVTFGDSVPAGSACGCEPFPDLYARLLSPAGRSVDLAQGGYTSADVLRQLADPGTRDAVRGATVVLIMVGANDLAGVVQDGDGDDSYRAAAAGVRDNVVAAVGAVRAAHAAPVPVVVLGYWNVVQDGAVGLAEFGAGGERRAASATRYANDALRAAAARTSAAYLPTYAVFKGDDGARDPTDLLAPDGDHPNARGHAAIAAALYAATGH
jgi:acyl-CoA thioesterase I